MRRLLTVGLVATLATLATAGTAAASWTSVNTGQNHACGVLANGEGWCWGNNTVGELGSGSTSPFGAATPQRVAGGHSWRAIDGGDDFTCGLDTGGAAWCWGSGWHGQLGNGRLGDSDPVTSPNRVVGGLTFARIAAGNSGNLHACALTSAGAAYCWGDNTYGQLGTGSTSLPFGSATPVAVRGGQAFTDIAVGRDSTCAIATDAAMWCWGDDEIGQLGDGAGAPGRIVPTPVLVAGGHRWRAVDVGDSHTCGVDMDGVARCWGQDAFGELGLGLAGASSNMPAAVATSTRFLDIGTGTYDTCAVATTGRPWCWGYAWYGTLGNGTKNDGDPHPTPTPAATTVSFDGDVSGGYLHACGLGSDDRAYCWGYGADGQIGSRPEYCQSPDGPVWCSSVPFPVAESAAAPNGRRGRRPK
jgi:alpha-tubulin suppressor-like RCC1 family protein